MNGATAAAGIDWEAQQPWELNEYSNDDYSAHMIAEATRIVQGETTAQPTIDMLAVLLEECRCLHAIITRLDPYPFDEPPF